MDEQTSPSDSAEKNQTSKPKRRGLKSRLFRLLIASFILIAMLIFLLAVFQRSLIYFPAKIDSISPEFAGLAEGQVHTLTVTSDDGIVRHGWHVLPVGRFALNDRDVLLELERDVPVVLIFPGNAGNRSYRVEMLELLTSLGVHTILVDYRGYGENRGSPSEEKFARDADSLWKYVTEKLGVPHSRIIILGESLGGGVATRLAAEMCRKGTPPQGLILKATFNSLIDVAAFHYPLLPVEWVLVDKYRSNRQIKDLTCPLLMIHGRRDRVVPFELGRKLFDVAPAESINGISKEMVELPVSGHNDILITGKRDFKDAVRKFLRTISQ